MNKINNEIKGILRDLLDTIVPEGMTAKERNDLATKAGISPETLRAGIRKRTLNADTLIRLLLARGVSSKHLRQLPQAELRELPKGESDWILLGRELSEVERQEFVGLIRYLRMRWHLK